MLKQLYVGKLFALLHELGTTQQAVAKRLRVKRATVAGWGAGQRPVPVTHVYEFCHLAAEVLGTACDKAWAENQVYPDATLLQYPCTARAFELHLNQRLEFWAVERHARSQKGQQQYDDYARQLLPYLHLRPQKLSPAERETMQDALRGLQRLLRRFDHLEGKPTEKILGPAVDVTPLERFWQIAYWDPGGETDEEGEPPR